MGMMDRDYWKEKHNKKELFILREYGEDSFKEFDDERKQNSKIKNLIWVLVTVLTILALILSSLIEQGFRYKDAQNFIADTKYEIANIIKNLNKDKNLISSENMRWINEAYENQEPLKKTENRINTKMVPTFVTELQTNFSQKIEGINLNFIYVDYLHNAVNYDLTFFYYTNLENTYGSIFLKPLRCDSLFKCNVSVGLTFWGKADSNLGLKSSYGVKVCDGKFIKGKYVDDKYECGGNIAVTITRNIDLNLREPINFNLAINKNTIVINILGENKKPEMIGEFTLPKQFELQKSVMSSIFSSEKISNCSELKPIKIAMDQIINTNNNEKGYSFPLNRVGDDRPCSNLAKTNVLKDKVILMVEK